MPAEAIEISGTGTAGIDERGAAAAREDQRVDTQRRPAPIDMSVQVDQAGRDDPAGNIVDLRSVQARRQGCNASVRDTDIKNRIDALAGVDNPPAAQNQIERGHWLPLGHMEFNYRAR